VERLMLRRTLTGERGQALPLVLGMILIFSISIATVITLSSATSRDAKRENAHDVALSIAEDGVANALSVLSNATNPLKTTTLPSSGSPQHDTVDGGTVDWYGSLSGDVWTITATSTVKNPTGGGSIVRTVQASAEVGSTTINQAWNYVYAASSGCLNLNNSTTVTEPLYTRGNLCLNNSAKVTGSTVYVEGHIDMNGSGSIGTSATPIAELHVVTGCGVGGAPYSFPCTAAQKVYVVAGGQSQVTPGVTKPPLDLSYWYANAKPGPMQACTSGSYPSGFDTDTTMNRSRANVDLFASNYDCTVTIGGTQVGRIAYTSGNPGSFVIDGTVFFDGNIVMNGSDKVLYSGRGTIYASGYIDLQGSQQICGAWSGGCDFTNWQPSTSMLVLVSGSTSDNPSFNTGQSMKFQGGIYAAGNYTQGSSVQIEGPKIADSMTIGGSSQSIFPAYTYLPPGAPQVKPILLASGWKG
jgi:hypothetical protein